MARSMCFSVILLALVASSAPAPIILKIHDEVEEYALIDAVSGQKPVKDFRAEIGALEKTLTANNRAKIEKILGKPAQKPGKDYAMPVGQPRMIMISGLRYADEKLNKDHTEFYPVHDFAGIEVHYGIDGESSQYALLYFKVDKTFPKLKKLEEDKPAKVGTPTRKHTIDLEHWDKMEQETQKEKIAEIFSAPAGDYAPGTEYFTRAYGWRRGKGEKVHETLEWRSEKGRIVVEFDEKGNFVTSEFYYPGRDPVTNVAERLKWDREKFAKVKKYLEERLAQK
jgi:hypothetical protein